ncbi:Phr family secreted Rap phosphatase inhibitor [Bacillus thuringiensis]|uniref:Phr family secreted Rap phosphatase inhibitor n=1 Tax=Bacillus thuringiensis TaxID=1428 RepID=UPI002157899F|nr:Phr family secreted Rap phosphatase inhibitor [Bacillus thuringiensis]MCR6863191.1 Phr family secreted Rap phosphatase inhibitor [Bacillus thuringiensis]
MKKVYLTILGISLISILSLGLNDSFKNQAVNIGDGWWCTARPDYFLQTHSNR